MDWRRIPSLASLRAFEAAARHGGFTRAAAELNVTQAAVAQHVRKLEEEFGQTLVVRAGRGIAVTGAGTRLAARLREGFEVIGEGVEDLRAENEARPLNISVTPAFAANWLMPKIGDFWAKHPEVSLNLNPSIDLVDLRRDGFDLGVRYGAGNWEGLEADLLTGGDFWVVAQPALVAGRAPSCVADLKGLTWIFEEMLQERRTLVEREGLEFAGEKVTLLNTNAMAIAAVKAGLGVGIQPKSLVEDDVARGELLLVCALNYPGHGYYLVTVPGRVRPGLKVFTRWLKGQV